MKEFKVSELSEEISKTLNDNFNNGEEFSIIGEINDDIKTYYSNFESKSYITLKDTDKNNNRTVTCVIPSTIVRDLKLAKGVLIRGRAKKLYLSTKLSITIYPTNIEVVDLEGEYKKKLKELTLKLEQKGYFNISRKRKIVQSNIKNICVITSIQGAVIKDIIKNIRKVNTIINIYCINCKVQGDDAANTIISALQLANSLKNKYLFDAIIIARGGGSVIDLMPYNDEKLAEAIFASDIPVISAVGHEEDVSISDKVADVTCSTPTAAASFVAFNQLDVIYNFTEMFQNIHKQIDLKIKDREKSLNSLLDSIYISGIGNVDLKISHVKQEIRLATLKLESKINNKLLDLKSSYEYFEAHNFNKTLERGLTLSTDPKTEKYIRYSDLEVGKMIKVEGSDYKLLAEIKEFEKK